MTTTQTGSGPIAAPDGGSKGQPRIVPTRPGHWLIEADPLHSPDEIQHEVVRIRQGGGGLLIVGKSPARVDQRPDIVWLAPIPGPAVLAALAKYTAAIYAIDNAPVDSEERDEAFEDWEASRSKMHAAIRAERDGGA